MKWEVEFYGEYEEEYVRFVDIRAEVIFWEARMSLPPDYFKHYYVGIWP